MEIELPIVEGGQIDLCRYQDCQYACCDFASGNFIALYPGELAAAQSSNSSISHLELAEDECGGHKAICRAADKANCDGGYKPLDCRTYPFFPTVEADGELALNLKGSKCPLEREQLALHYVWALSQWKRVLPSLDDLRSWLRITSSRLIGYESSE